MQFVIFTDLDGTLLDSDYSFEEAKPALKKVKEAGVPLILTTSKTRTEVVGILQEMELNEPFIIENGAALYLPLGYRGWVTINTASVFLLGIPYAEIRAFIQRMTPRFKIKGFGDCTVREIADLTGLPYERAVQAKAREFTEPFLLDREIEDYEELAYCASRAGIKILRGGRFRHFMGVHQDKGKAVKIAKSLFRRRMKGEVRFIGIGNSASDLPLLEHVDHPVLIPHEDGSFEDINLPNLIRAAAPGSLGWAEAVESLLWGDGANRSTIFREAVL